MSNQNSIFLVEMPCTNTKTTAKTTKVTLKVNGLFVKSDAQNRSQFF